MARGDDSRGLRDEANVGPDPRRARELRRMSELGRWKVADGEPDISGWPVYASTGRELGVVDDLLVDTEAGEVVMLDVDLKRDDRHTLAPLRAAWIDRGSKRVVLDAREVARAEGVAADSLTDTSDALPALPRHGALTDDEVRRFNDDYVRAYGRRGVDDDRDYRLRRGDEEIRFGLQPRADLPPARPTHADEGPRRLLSQDERPHGDPLRPIVPGAAGGGGAAFDESREINRTLADLGPERRAHAAATPAPAPGSQAGAPVTDRRDFDRTGDRDAELDALPDSEAIEPRELDGRVRIDEGGTVDDETPVSGVRYDTPNYPRHDYELAPEYDSTRVVSRHPADRAAERVEEDAADVARRLGESADRRVSEDRRVRYRTYPDDVGRPNEERR
jgi:sporulation protein YlmC with PRC-barrel domain